MPHAARVRVANVAAVFLDVRDEHDFRIFRMRVMREKYFLDVAEAPRERDQLRLAQLLLREAHDAARIECIFDAAEVGIGQGIREIDAGNFRAEDILGWRY